MTPEITIDKTYRRGPPSACPRQQFQHLCEARPVSKVAATLPVAPDMSESEEGEATMSMIHNKITTQGPAPTQKEIEKEKRRQMNLLRKILHMLDETDIDNVENKAHYDVDRHHWARGI